VLDNETELFRNTYVWHEDTWYRWDFFRADPSFRFEPVGMPSASALRDNFPVKAGKIPMPLYKQYACFAPDECTSNLQDFAEVVEINAHDLKKYVHLLKNVTPWTAQNSKVLTGRLSYPAPPRPAAIKTQSSAPTQPIELEIVRVTPQTPPAQPPDVPSDAQPLQMKRPASPSESSSEDAEPSDIEESEPEVEESNEESANGSEEESEQESEDQCLEDSDRDEPMLTSAERKQFEKDGWELYTSKIDSDLSLSEEYARPPSVAPTTQVKFKYWRRWRDKSIPLNDMINIAGLGLLRREEPFIITEIVNYIENDKGDRTFFVTLHSSAYNTVIAEGISEEKAEELGLVNLGIVDLYCKWTGRRRPSRWLHFQYGRGATHENVADWTAGTTSRVRPKAEDIESMISELDLDLSAVKNGGSTVLRSHLNRTEVWDQVRHQWVKKFGQSPGAYTYATMFVIRASLYNKYGLL
jgi:hypothetical protein